MLGQQVPSNPFSAQGPLPEPHHLLKAGLGFLSAQSCPGHQHSLVLGCQHRSPEMPVPAAQSLDGNTGGLLGQNWDVGVEHMDRMPRRQQGSHHTGEDNTPQQSSAAQPGEKLHYICLSLTWSEIKHLLCPNSLFVRVQGAALILGVRVPTLSLPSSPAKGTNQC